MAKAFRFLGVLAIFILPGAARAQVDIGGTQHVLTIHATVAADQKAAQKIGYDAISMGFSGSDAVRWLGVAAAVAYDGDAFLGREYLETTDGYTPNLLAAGKADLLAKLRNAPTGSRLVVNGIMDQSARTFFVGSVKVTPGSGAP